MSQDDSIYTNMCIVIDRDKILSSYTNIISSWIERKISNNRLENIFQDSENVMSLSAKDVYVGVDFKSQLRRIDSMKNSRICFNEKCCLYLASSI